MIKKIIIFTIFTWLLSACSDNIKKTDISNNKWNINKIEKNISNLKTVWVSEFKKELEKGDWVLIDLRTDWEVAEWVIPWALQIDFYAPDFREKINSLDKNKKYLIYCRSGARSWRTFEFMKQLWFKNVINLKWWILNWINSGEKLDNLKNDKQVNNSEERIITLNARKFEFDKKNIKVKAWEKVKIKVNNIDWLHWIWIPDMKLVWDKEILLDTSKTWTFEFRCANYCWEWHQDMTWKIIIE